MAVLHEFRGREHGRRTGRHQAGAFGGHGPAHRIADATRELRYGQSPVNQPENLVADARTRRRCVDHGRSLMAIDGLIPEIWDTTRFHDLACWSHGGRVTAMPPGHIVVRTYRKGWNA